VAWLRPGNVLGCLPEAAEEPPLQLVVRDAHRALPLVGGECLPPRRARQPLDRRAQLALAGRARLVRELATFSLGGWPRLAMVGLAQRLALADAASFANVHSGSEMYPENR
jgi:hypothetical protein